MILCSYATSAQIVIWSGNRENVVDTVTGLRAGQSKVQISAGKSTFRQNAKSDSGAHPASYSIGTGGSFLGVKRPKREVGYSPIYRVNIQNEWSCTSIPCMPTWREEGRLRLYLVRSDWHVPTVVEQGQWTPCMKPHLRARADLKRNFLRSNDHQIARYIQEICK